MIPPFHDAVDNATSWLAEDGLLGIADFYVSGKYDQPMRQMPWGRRFFWRWAGGRLERGVGSCSMGRPGAC